MKENHHWLGGIPVKEDWDVFSFLKVRDKKKMRQGGQCMHSYSQNLSNRFPQIRKKIFFLSSSRNLPVVMSLRGTDALVTMPLDRCWLCPKGWFCVCYLPTMWKVQQGSENIYSANRRLKCSASLRTIFFSSFKRNKNSFLIVVLGHSPGTLDER